MKIIHQAGHELKTFQYFCAHKRQATLNPLQKYNGAKRHFCNKTSAMSAIPSFQHQPKSCKQGKALLQE
uniref:Uncharacterized protein n=1 Tax=Kuenenia stuttgartiensis TaxID=174633 RepID=Q1Q124_KUEST|nr:unknown protein [Candidatus Kuenenia stuttgartiensis]